MENSERIKNYYDALRKLYSSLYNSFESSLSGAGFKGSMAKMEAKIVGKRLENILNNLETMQLKQQERLDKMTPEEFKSETLKSLTSFEEFMDSSYKGIKEGIEKQKTYVNSPDFVKDAKTNAAQSQQLLNEILDELTKTFNSMTDDLAKSNQ